MAEHDTTRSPPTVHRTPRVDRDVSVGAEAAPPARLVARAQPARSRQPSGQRTVWTAAVLVAVAIALFLIWRSLPARVVASEVERRDVARTLVLTVQPSGNVTIPVSSSDTTEGAVSATSVVFTAANWNVPQFVTVSGQDDALTDGPQPYTIVIGPATGGGYDGVNPDDLAFTNADNDVGGIIVGTPTGTFT